MSASMVNGDTISSEVSVPSALYDQLLSAAAAGTFTVRSVLLSVFQEFLRRYTAQPSAKAVAARDSQADRQRPSDFPPDHQLSGADGHAGGVAVRPLVAGKLLPLYARTLRLGPPD